MISVVMPTMWRSNKTPKLLESLNSDPNISEIVLIDNDVKSKNIDLTSFNKIKYLPQSENIYVNPAWNLGVSLCKSEIVCIVNDDIYFDSNKVTSYVLENSKDLGSFGLNMHAKGNSVLQINKERIVGETGIYNAIVGCGYGMLMFIKKANWTPIPEGLKIWYGDNWIIKFNKPSYLLSIHGCGLEVDRHTTAGSNDLKKITREDSKIWKNI